MERKHKEICIISCANISLMVNLAQLFQGSSSLYCKFIATYQLIIHLDDFFNKTISDAKQAHSILLFTSFPAHLLNTKKISEKSEYNFKHIHIASIPQHLLLDCVTQDIDLLTESTTLIKALYPKVYYNEYSANEILAIINTKLSLLPQTEDGKQQNFVNNLKYFITYERIDLFAPVLQLTVSQFLQKPCEHLPMIKAFPSEVFEQIMMLHDQYEKKTDLTSWLEPFTAFYNSLLNEIYPSPFPPFRAALPRNCLINAEENSDILISFHLNTNRPAQLQTLFDNIENTAQHPERCEFVINIDDGDELTEKVIIEQQQFRKFTIKYTHSKAPRNVCDLWKPLNKLYKLTNPNAYYLLNLSDEMLFATSGWDLILDKYVGYFDDDLFRLRSSRNKHRNYFDRWECSFAQDSIPITTKKWVDAGGDWNPCFGPDSFQQLVSFYLMKHNTHNNINSCRDIPLNDIQFQGDVPGLGIAAEESIQHARSHVEALFICQSHKFQIEANRRAMKIQAQIDIKKWNVNNPSIKDSKQCIYVLSNDAVVSKYPYHLSRIKIFLVNNYRKLYFKYYFGEGLTNKNLFKGIISYLAIKFGLLRNNRENVKYSIFDLPIILAKFLLHPGRVIKFIHAKTKAKINHIIYREKLLRHYKALINKKELENRDLHLSQSILSKNIQRLAKEKNAQSNTDAINITKPLASNTTRVNQIV